MKILIENRGTVHRKLVSFVTGTVVITRLEVQSGKSLNKVGKLCYQVRKPFTIVKPTGHGSYTVRRFGKLTSPQLKQMTEELYASPTLYLMNPTSL